MSFDLILMPYEKVLFRNKVISYSFFISTVNPNLNADFKNMVEYCYISLNSWLFNLLSIYNIKIYRAIKLNDKNLSAVIYDLL